jgi:hypothetical protein
MPAWLLPLVMGLGMGAQAIGSSISSRRNAETQAQTEKEIADARIKAEKELAQMNAQAAWQRQTQQTASEEASLDPFRQQLYQGNAISWLDRMERERLDPINFDWSGNPYAHFIPQMSGGYSYEQSPELRQSAADLKRNVMSGMTAPSMTDPANYGRTAALNLLATAGGVDPASAGALAQPYDPFKTTPTTDPYQTNAALRRAMLGAKGVQLTPRGRRTT